MSVKKRFAKKGISMMLTLVMIISLFGGIGPFSGLTASAASASDYPTGVTYSATARVDESIGLRATASIGSAVGISPTDTRMIRQDATMNATNSSSLQVTVTPVAKYTLTGVVVAAIATITHSDKTKEAVKDIFKSTNSTFTYEVPDFSSYVVSGDKIDVEIVVYADLTYTASNADYTINLNNGTVTANTGGSAGDIPKLGTTGMNARVFAIDAASTALKGKTIEVIGTSINTGATNASATDYQIYAYSSAKNASNRRVDLILNNAVSLVSNGMNLSNYETFQIGQAANQGNSFSAAVSVYSTAFGYVNRQTTSSRTSYSPLTFADVDVYVTLRGNNILATGSTYQCGGATYQTAIGVDASASLIVTDASTGTLYARGGGCASGFGSGGQWPAGYMEFDGGDISVACAATLHCFSGIGNGGHYDSTDPGIRGMVFNGGKVTSLGRHIGIGAIGGTAAGYAANVGKQYVVVTGGEIEAEGSAASAGAAIGFSRNNEQHEVRIGRPDKPDPTTGNDPTTTLTAVNWGYGAGISGKMTFYSGTTKAYSGQFAAAIGGNAISNATINNVIATDAYNGSSAVGGTPLTVYGGNVTAVAGAFSQIAYGNSTVAQFRGNTGTRTSISAINSEIRPTVLTGASSSYGAGIGGSVGMDGGTLNNIFAGSFNVTSSVHGAGIGGGGAYNGTGGNGGETWIGNLTDNNTGAAMPMNFNVESDEYGAGIGGGGSSTGNGGNGGNLYIGGETDSRIVARWDPTLNSGAGDLVPGQYNFDIKSGKYGAGIGGGGSLTGNGGFGATGLVISGGNFGITAGGTASSMSFGAGIGGGGSGSSSATSNGGDGPSDAIIKGGYFNAFSLGYGAAIGGGGANNGTGGSGGKALYSGGTVVVDAPTLGSVGMGGGNAASGGTPNTDDGVVTIIGGNVYTEIDSVVDPLDPTQHAFTLPYAPGVVTAAPYTSTSTAIKIELDKSEIGKIPDQVAYYYGGDWRFDYGVNSAYVTADVDSNGNTIGIMWVWVPSEYLLTYDLTSGYPASAYSGTLPGGNANDFDINLAKREAVGFTYVQMEQSKTVRVYNYPGETKTLLEWDELMTSGHSYDGATWGAMAPTKTFHLGTDDRLYQMAEHAKDSNGNNVYLIGWTDRVGGVLDNGVEHIFAESDNKTLWDYTIYLVDTMSFSNTDKTVYAMWGDDQNNNGIPDVREGELTLTYDTNGGVDGPGNNMKYRYGDSVGIAGKEPVGSLPAGPVTPRTGCVFIGWSAAPIATSFDINASVGTLPPMYRNSSPKTYNNGKSLNYDTSFIINGSTILYAVWADDVNGNGIPDFLEDARYVKHDGKGADAATVPADKPFVDGQTGTSDTGAGMTWTGTNHIFCGWTEDSNATFLLTSAHTTADEPADLDNPLTLSAPFNGGSKTVYAVWAEDLNNNGIEDYKEDAYYFVYDIRTTDVVTGVPSDTTSYYENDPISIVNNNLLDAATARSAGGMTDYMKRDGWTLIGWTATVPVDNDFFKPQAEIFRTNNGVYPNDPSLFGSMYLLDISTAGPNGNGTFGAGDASIYAVWGIDTNNNGVPDWDDEDGRMVRYIPTIGSVIENTMPFYNAADPSVYLDKGPSTSSDFTNYTSDETVALSTQRPQSNSDYVFMGWSPVYVGGLEFGVNNQNKAEFFALLALLEDITNGTNVSGNNSVAYMTQTGRFAQAKYTKTAGVSDLYDQAVALGGGGAVTPENLYQIYDAFNWAGDFNGQGLMDTVTFDGFDQSMMSTGLTPYSATWRAYAVWAKDVNGNGIADIFEDKYTLFYHNDVSSPSYIAATGGPAHAYNKYPGQVVPLNITNKPGKLDGSNNPMVFLGWTVDQNVQECYGRNDGDLIPPLASAVTFGDFDINVYAVWALDDNNNGIPDVYENNIYDLIYDANGGVASSVPVDSTSYRYNDVATVDTATIPTHSSGHIFLYWTDDASTAAATYGFGDRLLLPVQTTSITFTNSSVTLLAVWGEDTNNNGIADVYEDQYTLTYDANGGANAPTDGNLYTSTNMVYLAGSGGMTNSNNLFVGWTTALPSTFKSVFTFGEQALLPTMVTDITFANANITVYAVWSTDNNQNQTPDVYENANTFTVTYSANGGTGTLVDSNTYPANATVTVLGGSSLSRNGHTFSGWNTAAGGNGTSYASGATFTITGNVTLYAQWTNSNTSGPGTGPGTTSYNVTYNANGGSGSKVVSVNSGNSHVVQSVTAAGITYPGYTFKGWNTTANGSGTSHAVATSISVTANITLYAQWEKTDPDTPVLERDDHILYIIGYPEGGVRPEASISRAESAMIFFRLLSTTAHIEKNAPVDNKFSDIEGTEWHAQAINYLAKYNIISGYSDGTFRPNTPITRAEFATMASRFDELASTGSNIFTDVGSDHWAVSYINSAAKKGWITGYSDDTFKPEQNICRSEAITLVNRVLNRAMDENAVDIIPNPYNDIKKDHWAYKAVMEASYAHDYTRESGKDELWDLSAFKS